MRFAEELINLLPKKFHSVQRLVDYLEACGDILDQIHAKIDGLPDLLDKHTVAEEYMVYLSNQFGWDLIITPGTSTEERKRMILKSITPLIKRKGTKDLISDLAKFYYTLFFPGASFVIYELWTADYETFERFPPYDLYSPSGWVGDDFTTSFSATLRLAPVALRSLEITAVAFDDSELSASDNGEGILKGDVEELAAGENTIDYTTGLVKVKFSSPVKVGTLISVQYIEDTGFYLSPHFVVQFPLSIYSDLGDGDVFAGLQVAERLIVHMDELRPAHTVMRIVIGGQDDFWRVGVSHQRVFLDGGSDVLEEDRLRIGGAV